jgi:hypothetical protein
MAIVIVVLDFELLINTVCKKLAVDSLTTLRKRAMSIKLNSKPQFYTTVCGKD